MVDIPKTIHVLVVIVYPNVQDTLLDTMPDGERFNKQSHKGDPPQLSPINYDNRYQVLFTFVSYPIKISDIIGIWCWAADVAQREEKNEYKRLMING